MPVAEQAAPSIPWCSGASSVRWWAQPSGPATRAELRAPARSSVQSLHQAPLRPCFRQTQPGGGRRIESACVRVPATGASSPGAPGFTGGDRERHASAIIRFPENKSIGRYPRTAMEPGKCAISSSEPQQRRRCDDTTRTGLSRSPYLRADRPPHPRSKGSPKRGFPGVAPVHAGLHEDGVEQFLLRLATWPAPAAKPSGPGPSSINSFADGDDSPEQGWDDQTVVVATGVMQRGQGAKNLDS